MNQTRNIILVFIIMLILGREMFNNKNVIFPTQFCLGSIFDGFSATQSIEVSLNGNLYDFSVDQNSVGKSDILNILKYLMTKNNIKNARPY